MKGFFSKEETKSSSRPDGKTYSCVSCGLLKDSNHGKIEAQGNFKKKILIVGKSSNEIEDRAGILWRGNHGVLLKNALASNGIDLFEDCLSINAVRCFCEKDPTNYHIDCCRRNITKIMSERKPKIVICLGISALYSLIGLNWKKGMGDIKKWAGWQIPDQFYNTWVCPTFHPEEIEDDDKVSIIYFEQHIKNAIAKVNDKIQSKEPVIDFIEDLSVLNDITSDMVSIDYETTGLKPHASGHRIVCASVADTPDHAYVFMMPETKQDKQPFIDLLANPAIKKLAHNMKFEQAWSVQKLRQSVKNWHWDSMQAAHILDPRPDITSLKFQAYINFGVYDYDSEISPYLKSSDEKNANAFNKINDLLNKPGGKKQLLTYCAFDTIYEYRLALLQMEQINKLKLNDAYDLFHTGILSLAVAEKNGLCIDTDYINEKKQEISEKINHLEKEFKSSTFYRHWLHFSKGNINIDSNPQLANFLYKGKKLTPVKTTAKGKGATDDDALSGLKIKELDDLLTIRKLKKLRNTYLEVCANEQVNGVMHPFFNLHTVRTYRSSSNNPNFQNFPKRDKESMKIIRSAIHPRPGHQLMEIDFSQLEVAIAACYHKDPVMLDYLIHKKDMHGDMAQQIFMLDSIDKHNKYHAVLRQTAKNGFVFPQFYGDYYKNNASGMCSKWINLSATGKWKSGQGVMLTESESIADHLMSKGIKSFDDFCEHMKTIEYDFWNNRFPVYEKWKKKWYAEYLKNGYFKSKTGFIYTGVMNRKEVINYPVQGAAFHCLLWCFSQVNRTIIREKWDTRVVGQIHDAIVLDVNPDELKHVNEVVKRITTVDLANAWDWIIVPLRVETETAGIDESWAAMEEYKEEN